MIADPQGRRPHFMFLATLVGLLLFLPSISAAASVDEALASIGKSIARQLQDQGVRSISILQFTNLSGGQSQREHDMADTLARNVMQAGSVSFSSRVLAERVATSFNLRPGEQVYGMTAARIGKGAGVEALITATVEDYGGGVLELRAQAFSSQNGVNIATARASANKSEQQQPPPPPQIAQAPPAPTPPAPSPPAQSPSPPPPPSQRTQRSGDVEFTLKGCTRSGSSAKCVLLIKSLEEDLPFSMTAATRIIDTNGDAVRVGSMKVGTAAGNRYRSASITLPGGIPVKSEVVFAKVSERADSIALLEIHSSLPVVKFKGVDW